MDAKTEMIVPQAISWLPEDLPPLTGKLPSRDNSRYDGLVQLIKDRGKILTPIFIDGKGFAVSGHYRLWAALELRIKKVPVQRVKSPEDCLNYIG